MLSLSPLLNIGNIISTHLQLGYVYFLLWIFMLFPRRQKTRRRMQQYTRQQRDQSLAEQEASVGTEGLYDGDDMVI